MICGYVYANGKRLCSVSDVNGDNIGSPIDISELRKKGADNYMKIIEYETILQDDKRTTLNKKRDWLWYSDHGDKLDEPYKIVAMMNYIFNASKLAEEYIWVLAMDTKNHPIGIFEISHGSVNDSIMASREVFIRLCLCGASNFVLVHNHPSGDCLVSEQDESSTLRIRYCGELMDIPLLDHIIIGGDSYKSLREDTNVFS